MRQRYLKLIIGLILILSIFNTGEVKAQENPEQLKILTEMKVDIKYIKYNIIEIKTNNNKNNEKIGILENRMIKTEERQISIKEELCEIAQKNNWVSGFMGSLMLILLGLQLKRNVNHRKGENGKIPN